MSWFLNHDLPDLIRMGIIALLCALVVCIVLYGVARVKAAGQSDEQETPAEASEPRQTVWVRVVGKQVYRSTCFVTFEMENGERMTLPWYAQSVPGVGEEGMLTFDGMGYQNFERI